MKAFQIEAVDPSGALRVLDVQAPTAEAAEEQAKSQGLVLLKVAQQVAGEHSRQEGGAKPLGLKALISFCRTLSISLRAGGNDFSDCLIDYAAVLGETTTEGVALKQAAKLISEGESPETALYQTGLFTSAFCNAVRSAQRVGYGTALAAMAERFSTQLAFRRKVIKGAAVPLVVLVITLTIAVVFFCVFVPMLEKMGRDMGSVPNAFTRAFLVFAHIFQATWWFGAVGVAFCVWMLTVSARFRQRVIGLLTARLRLIRNAIASVRQFEVISTFWALKKSDVDLADCLREAGHVVAGTPIEEEMQRAARLVSDGVSLGVALRNETSLDSRIVRMIVATQDTNLTEQLGYIAQIYREESEDKLDQLSTVLNILFVSLSGLILGVLFLAVYAFFLSLATGITISSGGLR